MWEAKEKELGNEVFEGAQRYVALQALDQLWMDHLDTMDHLRDSVRLRGYGQRDPLVEYKREGHQMFQRLIKEINRQIVNSIFHISVNVRPQQAQGLPNNLQTNLSSGSADQQISGSAGNLTGDPKFDGIGRNDPCPCGSGRNLRNAMEKMNNFIYIILGFICLCLIVILAAKSKNIKRIAFVFSGLRER